MDTHLSRQGPMQNQLEVSRLGLEPRTVNSKAHVASTAPGAQPRGKEQNLMAVTGHSWRGWGHWEATEQ